MNLSILSVKKTQLNASKGASIATKEAPVKKQVKNEKSDYSGVPEADEQVRSIKSQKQKNTTKIRTERKVVQKKNVASESEVKIVYRNREPKQKEPTKKTIPKFQIVHYSEKCIALFGDTKPIKEELKAMGGRFNANLRPFDDDNRVAGWIFPKKCEAKLLKLIK